jgi:hypothetical protein
VKNSARALATTTISFDDVIKKEWLEWKPKTIS